MTSLKALVAFCHVLRHGSLGAAAERMNLSQPAASRLISNLERDVRLTLFHRDRRALRPTDEARRFHREAERILAGVEHLDEIASDIRSGVGQRLRVVAMSRLAVGALPRAVASFRQRMPEVRLTVEVHHRRDMERWIAGRQFDIGFGPLPISEASLEARRLADVPLVAVMGRSSPIAEQGVAGGIGAAALSRHPMVALTPDTLLQSQVDAVFAAAGVGPKIGLRVSSSHVACLTAATGIGYAVADLVTASALGDDARVIPIEPRFYVAFGLLFAADHQPSSAAMAFADEMRDSIRSTLRVHSSASEP